MRALVVGYGRMGGFHAKVLRDLGYDVTTVDPDTARLADYTAIENAIPQPDALGFCRRVSEVYDVAAVAVPPEHLVDTAYRLAGMPMVVEKPFALNVRDASMIASYLEQQGSRVCVGFVERFNPQVRALHAWLRDGTLRDVESMKFTRWNDRPSFDTDLDLRLHDVDLAAFLGRAQNVSFDTRAQSDERVRSIEVTHADGVTTVDLMNHALSPLHGMWHAFLTNGKYPTPADAVHALWLLKQTREAVPA